MTDVTTPDPFSRAQRQGLQKFDLKLFLEPADGVDMDVVCDALLEVFGRWRLEEGEEIMDLADYAHVPQGPGILLIGHRWQFGIDWGDDRPGLFYSSRKDLTGTLAERLRQALQGLLEKGSRLLAEPAISPRFKACPGELRITVNDRLAYPNTDRAAAEVRPAVDAVSSKLFGAPSTIERHADPDRRLEFLVRVDEGGAPQTVEALAARLEDA